MRIIILGEKRELVGGYLKKILGNQHQVLQFLESDPGLVSQKAEVVVLTKTSAENLKRIRRFLRNLPIGSGIVVAYGRDGTLRRACKGFAYKFRFQDEDNLWPGLKISESDQLLAASCAARVAHELGYSTEDIKKLNS